MDSHHPLSYQLDTLLNDSEGVQQFHKFLSSSFSSGHLLDFWFACKGFRSIVDGDDQLKLLQVAKAIYRTYIKTDAALSVPVNESTKKEIRSTLSTFSQPYHNSINGEKRFSVLRSLFDAAQADVQSLLARSFFLEFLQSDSYKMIHQPLSAYECNNSLSHKPSHRGCGNDLSDKRGNFNAGANLQQHRKQSGSGEGVSETNDPGFVEQGDAGANRHAAKASTCGTISSDKSRRITSESCARELVTASELIAYMNPAGGNNNGSQTTNTINPKEHHPSATSKQPQIPSSSAPPTTTTTTAAAAAAAAAAANDASAAATAAATTTTTRKPGTNLAEVDPTAFAQTLSHRLEKVKESRGKMERLLSRMQLIDSEDTGGEDTELASIHAELNKPPPPTPPLPQRSTRMSSSSRRATSAASGGELLRKKLSALLPPSTHTPQQPLQSSQITGGVVPDDAQVILEDHCSRIWTDERRGQPLNVVCSRKSGGRRSDVYSISSFDSGVGGAGISVGGSGGGGGGGMLNSSDSESCASRSGGVFHHSHHNNYQRWSNYVAPPPPPQIQQPVCSFCRRTPSMSSTPATHRKEMVVMSSRWLGGVQYHHHHSQRTGQYQQSHHYTLEEGVNTGGGDCCGSRSMRSRSLTSDSPSVFDSGLSSTYDHLPPPPRRSRHDELKIGQQPIDGPAPTFGGRVTPLPGDEMNHRLLGDCETTRNTATPAGQNANFDLLNPSYLPPASSRAAERQKYAIPPMLPHPPPTTRCTESALLKTAPGFPQTLPPQQTPTFSLVVGYYLCDDPVPYRTVWTGPLITPTTGTTDAAAASSNPPPSITLGQFKQLVAKKGVYRYFFKTASDDFGTGCVHEEVGDDNAILPLWEGKVIARVERAD